MLLQINPISGPKVYLVKSLRDPLSELLSKSEPDKTFHCISTSILNAIHI